MDNLLDDNTKTFIKYVGMPMILVGLCSNLIAFGIFSRSRFRKHKIAYYSKINLISHCVCLLIYLLYNIFLIHNIELRLWSNLTCKLFPFSYRSFVQLSSWIEILITYDRNNSIRRTSGFRINNKRTFLKLTFSSMCGMLLINSPNLAFQLLNSNQKNPHRSQLYLAYGFNETRFDRYCLARRELIVFRDVLFLIFGIYLPLCIMIYLSVNLFKDLLNNSPSSRSLNQPRRLFKRQVYYGLTIFVLNSLFVLAYLPFAIIIITITIHYFNSPIKFDQTSTSRYYFINAIHIFVLSFYYSSTFFINILLNRHFIIEFCSMLRELNILRGAIKLDGIKKIPECDETTLNRQTIVMPELNLKKPKNQIGK